MNRPCPHPGAQLRFDDVQVYRLTAFVTRSSPIPAAGNSPTSSYATVAEPTAKRAQCEDRIRIAKDTGLANPPLQGVGDGHADAATR